MMRKVDEAMWRGFKLECPACGEAPLFSSFLKVAPRCPHCGEDFSHQRADDAPPYVTILIVGHIVVPALLVVEQIWAPPMWLQFAIWLPMIAILALLLLPRIKGAIVGMQWAMRMHGFGGEEDLPAKP
jgi:uncharacterized protein (DUF983 family)